MKGAMLYVDAGKGHYIPAKALADSFIRAGHEATVDNLLLVLGSKFWNIMTKYSWRAMLHVPRLEPLLTNSVDSRFNAYLMKRIVEMDKYKNVFSAWLEKERPDFIVSTNFIGGAVIPAVLDKLHLVHVLRVAHSGDDLGAAQLLGEGGDDDVLFVSVGRSEQKVEVTDPKLLEQRDALAVTVDGQDVHLLGDLAEDLFIFIYNGDRMIPAQKSGDDL